MKMKLTREYWQLNQMKDYFLQKTVNLYIDR